MVKLPLMMLPLMLGCGEAAFIVNPPDTTQEMEARWSDLDPDEQEMLCYGARIVCAEHFAKEVRYRVVWPVDRAVSVEYWDPTIGEIAINIVTPPWCLDLGPWPAGTSLYLKASTLIDVEYPIDARLYMQIDIGSSDVFVARAVIPGDVTLWGEVPW